MTSEDFQSIVHSVPRQPGVYKYFDGDGVLIYVGKAKDLRKRVTSYFVKRPDNYKTRKLVENIHHLEFTIVDTEQDAFLLENSLIKQFQPRYNINLKDDKSYPFIVIKNEPFPRVFLTRRVIKDGSEYLGPFTGVGKVRDLIEFIRTYIPLRTCTLNLTRRNIEKGKFKVCLEYHLGNCKGPCEGLQTPEDYQEGLQQVRAILKGNLSPVVSRLKEQMKEHAEKMEFEKAAVVHRKLESLQAYSARSAVVSAHIGDVDVFSIVTDGQQAYTNYLQVRGGSIVQTKTVTLERKLEESPEEMLVFAIAHLREKMNSFATEIVTPFPVEYPGAELTVTVPKAGDKKKLLDLSLKNVQYFREETRRKKMLRLEEATGPHRKAALDGLQDDLQLPVTPTHIECFDNSNFQGSFPVAACVVFKDGVASKKDYRHFNIKTVEGINDFASMSEVVYRRYKRLLDEKASLPQLVIIDGGKGQLSAAMESIQRLGLTGSMTLVGLAKQEEEIFFPGDKESLKLPYNGESLKLIRRIRDEVHRFGITFHRQKRSQDALGGELEKIPGIGKQTADQLLKKFRSVNKIRLLTERELSGELGRAKARKVWAYFHEEA
ncbi:MAG TPA: excinuclease ABC subunit UvrC [Chitinophagaceae bacterium]|jgi:excinuclease ABC subunit C|nr:excinuclease ABC subunit UvrC [Chitinophagaceae bacterium]